MQSPEIFHIPCSYIYRGEGNSSVVLSLPESREILRLRKAKRPKTLLGWFVSWIKNFFKWDDVKEEIVRERKNLRFYGVVMRSLLNEWFVWPARQVYVPKAEIRELDEQLYEFRPVNRREKRLQHGRATIFEDYTFLPKYLSNFAYGDTYSVEIKPKQGWVPLNQQKLAKCTFCLNQYLKLQKGEVASLSSYCPYDLFSGESQRMKNAIVSLVENPQNNLRVFRNGVGVYYEHKPLAAFYSILRDWYKIQEKHEVLLDYFCELIGKSLLTTYTRRPKTHKCPPLPPPPSTQTFSYPNEVTELLEKAKIKCNAQIDCDRLPEGCVLREILEVQRLDRFGCHLYSNMRKAAGGEVRGGDWGYIDELLKSVESDPYFCARCALVRVMEDADAGKVGKGGIAFAPYLLAAVARDCSIMLTFRRRDVCDRNLESKEIHSVMIGADEYVVSVGILDLYPKPMSTIKKHVKRSGDIYRAYKAFQKNTISM